MPRIRTIKPEMASDRKLSSVSRGARYTFVLLITQADDDGLVLGSPRQLLGQLYPHDETVDLATLSRELRELLEIGLIRDRETVDDAPVVEICNWAKHQRIDHRAKSLILPTLRAFSGVPREGLATPSRESRAPTLDLGPTTEDLRPDDGPARAHARRDLAKAANDALDQTFGTTHRRRALTADAGAAVLEVLDELGIPLPWALEAITAAVPELKEPPRSLAYFAPILRQRWTQRDTPATSPAIARATERRRRNLSILAAHAAGGSNG